MKRTEKATIPSSAYDDFLFAVICEEPNGTQLSVVSALTRVDLDPWEEAARLSSMTEPIARGQLMLLLNQASAHNWSQPEKAAIATRLIARLPSSNDRAGLASTELAKVNGRTLVFLVFWWSFAIAVSAASSYQQRVHKADGVSVPYSSTTVLSKDGSTSNKTSNATD